MKISVIIPCLNEEEYLRNLLDDLVNQTVKPDEVIVADCQSDDGTVKLAQSFKARLSLKVETSRTRTPGAARNRGAEIAEGDYLLFVDADMRVPRNFIEQIRLNLAQNPVDFLTPSFISDGKHWIDSVLVWGIRKIMFIYMKVLSHLWGIGGVMCVKKQIHHVISGFDPELDAHDDVDYARRLRRQHASFSYLRDLKTTTSSRRFEGNGLGSNFLHLVLYNMPISQWLIHPWLKKFKKSRKYGHYN